MTVLVSMLRGINVGGHKRIKMDAPRALYHSLGLRNSQTYVQSGNVIFSTRETDLALLIKRIEDGIEQTFGFRSTVIVRDVSELRKIVANNPFATRTGTEPRRLFVSFLAAHPDPEGQSRVEKIKADPEEIHLRGRELYIYYPHGMARPKVPWTLLEKMLKTPATARNWNSLTKLLALAETMQRTAGLTE